MRKRKFIPVAFIIAAIITFRLFPSLSGIWTASVIRPASFALHRLSGRIRFPIAEPIFITAAIIIVLGGLRAICAGIFRKNLLFFRSWLKKCAFAAAALMAFYGLMWYPAYWTPADISTSEPDAARIRWLCEVLIGDLNQSTLNFPRKADILAQAAELSGRPETRIKTARYPEWMHRMHISGLFVPWTGEVIIRPDTPAAALPFTAVHELMHLKGIADEGQANFEAWKICRDAGGPFFDSAKLWVLKYGLEILEAANPGSSESLLGQMQPRLSETFACIGGGVHPQDRNAGIIPAALGLSRCLTSYPDVTVYILNETADA